MLLSIDNKIYHLIRAVRPRQWIKNGIVFAPIVFQGEFFNIPFLIKATYAFILFSMAASAVYLFNDVRDIERDRLHPIKKNRPIASGKISKTMAIVVALVLIAFAVPIAFAIGTYFGLVLVAYLGLMALYNFHLKDVIILDALTIAVGFILRAYGGAFAIPLRISSWLVLAIIGTSLLLAFGKRRAERTMLEAQGISKESTRSILRSYPDTLLDSMISMSASFSIITYSLFTFQISPQDEVRGLAATILPPTLVGAKFLMVTIPIVIYGVARYLYVIYEKREGESPERVLLSDKPLLFTAVIWGLVVLAIMG